MDQLKNILVAVDFSRCSGAALRQGVRIAGANRARVSALHVVEFPAYAVTDASFLPNDFPPVDLLVSTARERWEGWAPAREAGKGVAFEALIGLPRMEIIDRADRGGVDLLVVGAHGDFDEKKGLGTIAAACVQHATPKVLVVREGQPGPFRSVAACIDFSETSKVALEQALRVAAVDGAKLHVLHVYTDPWHGVGPPAEIARNMPDFANRYRRAVEHRLKSFCEGFTHEIGALKGMFHAERFDAGGHGRGIAEFLKREGCDLVVIGTRSKWNLKDFVWGSTAERVLREATCAALAVKPAEFGRA